MNIFFRRPLAFAAAMFIVLFLIFILIPVTAVSIILVVGIAVLFALVLKRRRFDKLVGTFTALVASSLLCLIWSLCFLAPINELEYGYYNAVFEITEISNQSEGTAYFTAELESLNGEKYRYNCRFAVKKLNGELRVGDRVASVIEIIPFDDDEYGFDERSYNRSRNIWIDAQIRDASDIQVLSHTEYHLKNAVTKVRDYCVNSFGRYTGDDSAPFLAALTIGDKSDLDASVKRDMSRLGISHMIAISGMHLAIIMGCIIMLVDLMGFDKLKGAVIIIVLCVAYIIISGANGSVLRSGLMFILMSLSVFVRRDNDSLTSLFTAVALIIIFSPSSVFDIGLILSFTSTFGIIVIVGEYLRNTDKEGGFLTKQLNALKLSVITTLAAITFSLIPMIIFFDTFSVISVFTNLIFTPLITVILFGVLVFILFSPISFAAEIIGAFLDITVMIFLQLAEYISRIPDICVSLEYPFLIVAIGAFACGVAVAFLHKKRRLLMLAYVLWFTVYISGIGIYTLLYKESADIMFYSEMGYECILVRGRRDTVYIDLGEANGVYSAKAFIHLDRTLFAAELDHWIIARYSDDEIYAVSDRLAADRIHNLYIPLPSDDYERVIAEELEYYCQQQGTVLSYYRYDSPLLISDMSFTVSEPIALKDTDIRLLSATVEVGKESAVYYSRGYFECSDEYTDADIIITGSSGTARKQTVSPELECKSLVVADGNDIAVENIKCREIYSFDSKDTFCKLRIG